MLTHPLTPIFGASATLIGANNQVDQNDYGASVELELATAAGTHTNRPVSGEILHLTFMTYETGSGAVLYPAGTLLIFASNPSVTAGDTAVTLAGRAQVIAQVTVAATDWQRDANGATATIYDQPVAFPPRSSLYLAWFHEDATSFNDAAGDDEILLVTAYIRRDS
jgi:hypothetical protein